MTRTTLPTIDATAIRLSRPLAPECPDSGIRAGADPAASQPPPPDALPGLSVVLPCLDEAANVADAIRAAARAAAATSYDYEIIVVDDGSRDATAAIASRFARSDRRVRLVMHTHRRGYGEALRSGISAAGMPWVLLTDANLQFDLGKLDRFLPLARSAELVVGWRIMRRDRLRRRLGSVVWNWLVRRLFAVQVRDVDCALKLVRRDLLERCELTSRGAMTSTELVVKCGARGARIAEVGVHHRPRVTGTATGGRPRITARAVGELLALRRTLCAWTTEPPMQG